MRHFLGGMARASVCLLVCASVVVSYAAQHWDSGRFLFVKPQGYRRAADECKTCYGSECFDMKNARCELYTATQELLYGNHGDYDKPEVPTNDVRSQVDSLLNDFVEEASALVVFKECLPLISAYSDCTKENECLGCKVCSCDTDGLWNCSMVQHCREDPPASEDHRTLVAAMEALMNDNKLSRKKRWVFQKSPSEVKPHRMSYAEISQWMYGVKPFNYLENVTVTTEETKTEGATVSADVQNITTPNYTEARTDADYLAFEDVLNNMGLQGQTYSRRRPLDLNNITIDHEYMDFDNPNETIQQFKHFSDADHFIDILNAIEDRKTLEVTTDYTTEVVIDLLEVARKKIGSTTPSTNFNINDFKEAKDDTLNDLKNSNIENNNDFIDLNIMKRDVAKDDNIANNTSSTVGLTTTVVINETQQNDLVKTSVDEALDSLIDSKEKELKTLIFIRNQVIEYIKGNKSQIENIQLNDTFVRGNVSNAYYTFYNIVINPEPSSIPSTSTSTDSSDYRRKGKKKNDSYLDNLKRDILIVMRDLTALQKLMGGQKFSPPLKNLVRAMRHYIHNTEKIYSDIKNKMTSGRVNFNTRRHWIYPYPANKDLVKRYIVEILQVVDKDMPESNALDPLSPKSREIIRRMIKNQVINDPSFNTTQSVYSEYNLDNIKDIGLKWNAIAALVEKSKPTEKLYNLKLLQLTLLTDITKIKDALEKMDFFRGRRLLTLTDAMSEKELIRINNDLKAIHTKINKILHFQDVIKLKPRHDEVSNTRFQDKKQTLIKHIRNLLRNSKNDIIELLRRKVPKSEIVKELAKKKLDDMSKTKLMKYKNVMSKWQNNLNIFRRKRSVHTFDGIKKRIQNILPKYLRGKVDNGLKNTTETKKKRLKSRVLSYHKRNKAQKLGPTTLKTIVVHVPIHSKTEHH